MAKVTSSILVDRDFMNLEKFLGFFLTTEESADLWVSLVAVSRKKLDNDEAKQVSRQNGTIFILYGLRIGKDYRQEFVC